MILERNTRFEDIKRRDIIKVYHSCSVLDIEKRFREYPDINIHVGSLYQALDRADYKLNDQDLYDVAYIHELEISLNGLFDHLIEDDGGSANSEEENKYKDRYNLLAYKNIAEGNRRDENLSLIILNKKNILNTRINFKLDREELEKELNNFK